MPKRASARNLLAQLAVGLFALIVLWLGTHVFQTEADRFNLGWIIVVVSATGFGTIRQERRVGHKYPGQWLMILLPGLVCLILDIKALSALQKSLTSPTEESFGRFAMLFAMLVSALLLWIVIFPFDRLFGPFRTSSSKWLWAVFFFASGSALGIYIVQRTWRVARIGLDAGSGYAGTYGLEKWVQEATFLIGAFLIFRIILPASSAEIARFVRDSESLEA